MNIGLSGHGAPAVGFEVPLEMLSACPSRIEQQCATLRRLVPHLAHHGADPQARTAAVGVMRCFDTAAVHHDADEEQDLFPALLESMAGSDAVCLRELTNGLAAEHRQLEACWRGACVPRSNRWSLAPCSARRRRRRRVGRPVRAALSA